MKQTSVFVQIGSRENNPIKGAISTLAEASGGVIVSQLVNDQEIEADIAVVDSVERALRAIKETDRTIVLFGSLQQGAGDGVASVRSALPDESEDRVAPRERCG